MAERVGRFQPAGRRARDLDDERVLVFFGCSARGKTSGMDLAEMHPLMAGVFHLREGRVTVVGYSDHELALEAVNVMKKGPPR